MTVSPAPRTSRRSFLKLGAAVVAGLALHPLDWAWTVPAISPLRVRSALPLPGYEFLPYPERLLSQLEDMDVALVPAEMASLFIQRGLLQPLRGPAGRAHDPEGYYTRPHAYRVAALRFPAGSAAPKAASWDDLWRAEGQVVWPASGRLLAGAALLRRGYSPNDVHPGHLSQAAGDLQQLRPRLAPQGAEHFDNSVRTQGAVAVVLVDPALIGQGIGLGLPTEGTMLVEYDWVITAGAARVEMARRFVDQFGAVPQHPRLDWPVRLIPLMPLPEAARAQHADIWAALSA